MDPSFMKLQCQLDNKKEIHKSNYDMPEREEFIPLRDGTLIGGLIKF